MAEPGRMAERRKVLYFHGFASSGATGTAQLLRRELRDIEVVSPDIPLDCRVALPFLRELCGRERPALVVGTSMGGMYAQQMRGFRRLLINPSFWMTRLSGVFRVGRFMYLNKRKDKQKEGRVTPEIFAAYREMEGRQFDGISAEDVPLCHAMFGRHDPIVHTYDTFVAHYPASQASWFDGEHRINDEVMQRAVLPKVLELLDEG